MKRFSGVSFLGITILILLFFAMMNIYNLYNYLVYIAFILCCFLFKNTIKIDISMVALLVLALSYLFFDPFTNATVLGMLKPFSYCLCYLAGYLLMQKKGYCSLNKTCVNLNVIILTAVFGMFSHFLLNLISNIHSLGMTRNTVDIWTGEIMAATGQAALACMAIGVAGTLIFSNLNFCFKIFGVGFIAAILFYNMTLACRTLIVLMVVVLVLSLVHYLINEYRQGKKHTALLAIFAVVVSGIILVNSDAIGSLYDDSVFQQRMENEDNLGLSENSRFDYKMDYIRNMGESLFGGGHIKSKLRTYAHDLYLDSYDEAGIFALISIVVFILVSAKKLIRCLKNRKIPFFTRQLLLCVSAVCYLEFFIEPIMRGMPWLFASFCLMQGAIAYILNCFSDGTFDEGEYSDENI